METGGGGAGDGPGGGGGDSNENNNYTDGGADNNDNDHLDNFCPRDTSVGDLGSSGKGRGGLPAFNT